MAAVAAKLSRVDAPELTVASVQCLLAAVL
jgi:hypothetical protein